MGYAYYKVGNYAKSATELEKLIEQKDVYSQNGSYTFRRGVPEDEQQAKRA
jgi:hypothetical protein